MIGRNGERGSGISALAARHDDDDDLAFCSDVAQGRMKGAPNETRTHSWRFASLIC